MEDLKNQIKTEMEGTAAEIKSLQDKISALEQSNDTGEQIKSMETKINDLTAGMEYLKKKRDFSTNLGTKSNMILGAAVADLVSTKENYNNKDSIKSALDGLSISDVYTGAGFIREDHVPGIVELLRNKTVIRNAGFRAVPMPNGNASITIATGGGTAYYIGQDDDIYAKTSKQEWGQRKLTAKKLIAATPIPNDLIRFADFQTLSYVQDDLLKVAALKEDDKFLYGVGSEFEPKGIYRYAVSDNKFDRTTTPTGEKVLTDMMKAVNLLDAGNFDTSNAVWLMRPALKNSIYVRLLKDYAPLAMEIMTSNSLFGIPIITSNNVTTQKIYLIEKDYVVIGTAYSMQVTVDTITMQRYDQTVVSLIHSSDIIVTNDKAMAIIESVTDW